MSNHGSNNDGTGRKESIARTNPARIHNRRFIFEQDVNEVLPLFERVFEKRTSRKLWEWKYLPPWTSESYAWVATIGDQIIGHLGVVPLRGQIKGEEVPFFQLGDVMTDPDYRSWNLYRQTMPSMIAKDLRRQNPNAVFYGFTGEQLGLWYTWFTSLGKSTFVERAEDRILRFAFDDETDAESSPFDLREWSWDTPELDEIWIEQKDSIRVGLVRDRAFLEWRYAKHPLYKYSLFGVYHSERPIGWIVTVKRDTSDQWDDEVRVQDLLLPQEFYQPVLKQACSVLHARSLLLWMPGNCLSPGVTSRDTGWQVIYHSFARGVSKSFLASRVFYTLGEADEWWW